MKNWSDVQSHFTVKLQGSGAERLLNQCARDGMQLWEIKRPDATSLVFKMASKDLPLLRKHARGTKVKVFFLDKHGMANAKSMTKGYSGFILGIGCFLAILFLASNMLWGVKISGAAPDNEHKIRLVLEDLGIVRGTTFFTLPSPEKIQKLVMDQIDTAVWIGVERKGTIYSIHVAEKEMPKERQAYSPGHLVAKKAGTITGMFIEKGKSMVKLNDYVQKGQVLVTGKTTENADASAVVASRGKVFAETWYQSTVEVPLQKDIQTLTGEAHKNTYVHIGSWRLKVWGFGEDTLQQVFVENETTPLTIAGWTSPFAWETLVRKETQKQTISYTLKEAASRAKLRAKSELLQSLGEDATIKEEKVLHQQAENGKVKLSLHYRVIENIAEPKLIVQGE
ncbi:sporulation protein YqfD [Aureibacillus halotolerans]|uniref:Stage IV sporulation protein n=1 Tax=Aureibacillus halotolerans TaxID=1508390 RepID=A0A4R6U5I2_9BACI|nr:sporulation protein YqfD [Aureibacillus halotolerans]TDQ41738.1 hypothetical protein EV213_103324 [Aureibacillus halotolerans]